MIETKAKTKSKLLNVKGIGDKTLEHIGDRVLEIIKKYAS
jgi:endonuclease III-like uncharacterized protein